MKVLFVNPPYMRLKGINMVYMPLGLGFLAQYLKINNISVSIYNADLSNEGDDENLSVSTFNDLMLQHHMYAEALNDTDNKIWQEIATIFTNIKPDIVGITVMSAKLHSAIKVAQILKGINPACTMVFGGSHATIAPDELLSFDAVDFVVRGEGEHTLLELCNKINQKNNDFTSINGLSFKYEGKVIHNPARALEKDINKFPFPDREDFLGIDQYSKDKISSIVSSRGCPYDCTFCGAKTTWTRKVRYRDVGSIIDEIIMLKNKYMVPSYYFWDDSFTVNRKRTEELLDKIILNKIDLPWTCTTRADLLDDALIAKMKKAGCFSVDIGLETASDRMLRIIKKNTTMKICRNAFSLLDKHNMNYGVFLMVGFPDETEEDILKTIEYAKNSTAIFLCLSTFTPYPGCESYEKAKEMGMIETELDWSRYSHQSPMNYFCKNIDRERYSEIVQELAEAVDKHNKKMNAPLKSYLRKIRYYTCNPRRLAKKIKQRINTGFKLSQVSRYNIT